MTLHMIGLGLSDEKDITVKGLETVKKSDYLYLEHYTSIMPKCNREKLEDYYGKSINIASRTLVEQHAEEMLDKAKDFEVAFLVVGDVFGATTHTDLMIRAKEKNIKVNIINNTSILNAVGNVGLELYKFGKTTSMVFFEENWKPKNVYEAIKDNQTIGLHTLILLDIKIAEPTRESIKKNIELNLPPRFMTVNQALKQLMELEEMEGKGLITEDTMVIGCARINNSDEQIIYGPIKELLKKEFGEPVHCLIVPGKLHFVEEEALNLNKK